ncbi:MAG: glycosyltransferase family 39 protein [Acidobacteriota bacterium]
MPAPFSQVAAHLAALVVLTLTAWAAGSWVTRKLAPEGWAERLAMPVAIGIAVLAHLGFLLASFRLLRPGVLITVIAAVFVIAGTAQILVGAELASALESEPSPGGGKLRPYLGEGFLAGWRRSFARPFAGTFVAITLGLIALVPLFVFALYPPTAFDETMYHLPFAQAFARSGGLPVMPALRFPAFPALAELLFAQSMLLAGEVATHLVSFLAVLATAGLLVAWGRRVFSAEAGWLAAALYLGNPIVVSLAATSYVEALLTLFVTGALFSAWNFSHSGERVWLFVAAAFAGTAAGVKYLGLFFAAAVFVDLAVGQGKPSRGRNLIAPHLFALAAFVVLAPTYWRIFAQTGSPIFPYLPGVFGSTAWDPIALKPLGHVLSPETLVRLVRLPWDVVFNRSAAGQQPPLSPFYLLGLPLLAIGASRDSRVRRLLVIPVVWVITFLLLPSDSRYLVAILPPVSLALAGAFGTVGGGRIEKRSFQVAVCALAFLPGWLYAGYRIEKQGPLPITVAERDRYLAEKLPLYPAVRQLDRISSVAYAFDAENLKYFYDGDLYGDWVGPASYRQLRPLLNDAERLHRELSALGASHLLVSKKTVRPPETAEGPRLWKLWFRKVYEDPAGEIFELRTPDRPARPAGAPGDGGGGSGG